jgi:hypothetical protein
VAFVVGLSVVGSGRAQESSDEAASRQEWVRELRTAEEQVHALKEQVFRSKATLQLLRELAVQGASAGGQLRVRHLTELPRTYRVASVDYYLDGKSVFSWSDAAGGAPLPRTFVVRDSQAAPGQHNVQVAVQLVGDGGGVFGYVEAYTSKVESSSSFDVAGGEVTEISVRLTTKTAKGAERKRGRGFGERPGIVYEERREAPASK